MTAATPANRRSKRPAVRWTSAVLASALVLSASVLGAGPRQGYLIAQSPWQVVILQDGKEPTPTSSATILKLGPGGRFHVLEVFLVKDASGAARFEAGQVPWVSVGTLAADGQGAAVTLHNVTVDGGSEVPDEQTVRTERATWIDGGVEFAGEEFVELCDPGLQAEADAWFAVADHLERVEGR